MFLYIAFAFMMIPIIMYYLNINPFLKNNQIQNDTSLLDSINELKSLNQYIDNGTSNCSPL